MQEFFAFIGRNWLHVIVVLALIVIAVDLHFFRRRMNGFAKELDNLGHELKYTRECVKDLSEKSRNVPPVR